MRRLKCILVNVPKSSGRSGLEETVHNAIHFGRWLDCELHFVCEPNETNYLESLVKELKTLHGLSALIVHPPDLKTKYQLSDIVRKYRCDLMFIENDPTSYDSGGDRFQEMLKTAPIPIMLVPKAYSFQKNPPTRFLVPLSGEEKISPSLDLALRAADQTDSSVDLLHVMLPGQPCGLEPSLESLGDQPHHEYRESIEKVAAEASPYSTPTERARIRHFSHCVGFTADEILHRLNQMNGAILVLEWRGALEKGHATTMKEILKKTSKPVILARVSKEPASRLRAGKDLQARP